MKSDLDFIKAYEQGRKDIGPVIDEAKEVEVAPPDS